ncbi:MAG TPA: metallophosphoesterase family protein [Dehalococcoidia bacterium]
MRIGVISDTHGYLDPAVLRLFAGVDRILHAGDIGDVAVIRALEAVAPVAAVRGNVDEGRPAGQAFPPHRDLTLGGRRVHLVHRLQDARPALEAEILVYGHTHTPESHEEDGRLYLNPGAAGRRGFHRERTVALLELTDGRPEVRIIPLGPRTGGER